MLWRHTHYQLKEKRYFELIQQKHTFWYENICFSIFLIVTILQKKKKEKKIVFLNANV